MGKLPDPRQHRKADHPILPIFIERWSPRAMSGEPVSDAELMTLFEAARWAPSTYNAQEWRFLYAKRGTPQWQTHFNLLMDANKAWCKDAAALVVAVSANNFPHNGKPNPVHTIDTGMAFGNILLQAASMGLVGHGMAGFDKKKAAADLKIPDDHTVEAMMAIGRPGDPDQLPPELKERETPTGRKKVAEFACEGAFAF